MNGDLVDIVTWARIRSSEPLWNVDPGQLLNTSVVEIAHILREDLGKLAAERLATAFPMTEGASLRVRDAKLVGDALKIAFADKNVKAWLRGAASARGVRRQADAMITMLSSWDAHADPTVMATAPARPLRWNAHLTALIPRSDAGPLGKETPLPTIRNVSAMPTSSSAIKIAEAQIPAKTAAVAAQLYAPPLPTADEANQQPKMKSNKQSLQFDNGYRADSQVMSKLSSHIVPDNNFDNAPYILKDHFATAIPIHKTTESIKLKDLLTLLQTGQSTNFARGALTELSKSENRVLLLSIMRWVETGGMDVHHSVQADLLLHSIKVYTSFNANATAYRLAASLINSGKYELLSASEKLRAENYFARAALRSGRATEAAKIYKKLHYQHPLRADFLFNYMVSLFVHDRPLAISLAKMVTLNQVELSPSDLIFVGDLLASENMIGEALSIFYKCLNHKAFYADGMIGLANTALTYGDREGWLMALVTAGSRNGLIVEDYHPHLAGAPFGFIGTKPQAMTGAPLVTVIMTTFNSAATVRAAIDSVLAQSAPNIELYVVDDVSADDTRIILNSIAQVDSRVKPIFNETNMGTYASKNRAIKLARGLFITFHDSDDWMHPARLSTYLEKEASEDVCLTSQWLRMNREGRVIVRRGGAYLHLNPASTFLRREAFENLGPFDKVRTGADAEMVARIRNTYGWASVTNLPDCLGLGLHHDESLTQKGATAFDEFRFSAVRMQYTEAWLEWHLAQLADGRRPSLKGMERYPIDVPVAIRVE